MLCSCQTVKTKEEKEVLEYFAGVVSDEYTVCLWYVVLFISTLC